MVDFHQLRSQLCKLFSESVHLASQCRTNAQILADIIHGQQSHQFTIDCDRECVTEISEINRENTPYCAVGGALALYDL